MDRVRGIDLARAVAIIGMFAAHVRPRSDPVGLAETLYAIPYGRAAVLFGLVAGVGVSLLAASPRATGTRTTLLLLWRAAILLPAGLALQHLDHGVFVILADYALLFVAAAVLVRLPDTWLLAVTAAAAAAGPVTYRWGELHRPAVFTRDPVLWGDPIPEILHGLVLSGPYPLITWLAPFAFGMWLGRRNLRSRRGALTLSIAGATIAVGCWYLPDLAARFAPGVDTDTGWWFLLNPEPHSQTPAWLIGSTASAAAALGLCLLVAAAVPRLSWPLTAAGQLAFTLYVLQLVALHLAPDALRDEEVAGALLILAGFTAVSAVLAVAWRAVFPRGPAEYVLRLPTIGFRG